MEPDRSAAQLVAESEGLLLDFDGPVCDVYAGSDPARIAREVAAAFRLDIDTDDPLDLISHALATGGPVDEIHDALTKTETKAVQTAAETTGMRELIETYEGPVAIVSNNASQAILSWLAGAGLRSHIDVITGRNPRHMKPDPWPLLMAVEGIGRAADRTVLVGDSLSDAQAARRAGVGFVGFANRPTKRASFEIDRVGPIVDSIDELLVSSSWRPAGPSQC